MYIVEGNIGVGKSTFLKLINKFVPEISTVPEPLESWDNTKHGQSLLTEFYNDTSRWAYTIETLTMISRVRHHIREAVNPNKMRLMERSVYSGHYCFAKNDFKNGHLTQMEWNIYQEWVNFLVKKNCHAPSGFIYLQASPQVCHDRMTARNRTSEASVSLKYLEQIHSWHEKFLIEKHDLFDSIKNTPILVLDCNEDFVDNVDIMNEHASAVSNFMFEAKTVENLGINALTS